MGTSFARNCEDEATACIEFEKKQTNIHAQIFIIAIQITEA